MNRSLRQIPLFDIALLAFVSSLFLMIGYDYAGHLWVRIWWGLSLLVIFIFLRRPLGETTSPISWAAILFGCFFGFEMVRAVGALLQIYLEQVPDGYSWLALQHIHSPLKWSLYLGFFILSFSYFREKGRTHRLILVMAWTGFFLAINTIPSLMVTGTYYVLDDGGARFFHPAFYFHEWIPKYVLTTVSHSNFVGDIIAMGFFPSLGLVYYGLQKMVEARKKHAGDHHGLMGLVLPIILYSVVTCILLLSILLLFSRGTMVCLAASFLIFLWASLVKFPSRIQLCIVIGLLGMTLAFGFWSGKLQNAWNELQTIQKEVHQKMDAGSTAAHVREGAKRAFGIYRDYPIWGVGEGGYKKVATRYATLGTERLFKIINFQSMCHYLHVMAEEGVGAFIYFLFLSVYLFEVSRGLVKTKSRFQFIMALSLFMPVLATFGHAAVNSHLQRFATSMLAYFAMGASLGILRRDFQHNR